MHFGWPRKLYIYFPSILKIIIKTIQRKRQSKILGKNNKLYFFMELNLHFKRIASIEQHAWVMTYYAAGTEVPVQM